MTFTTAQAQQENTVSGSYTGNGNINKTIQLPFTPSLIYVNDENNFSWIYQIDSGVSFISGAGLGYFDIGIIDNGFTVGTDEVEENWPNIEGVNYFYTAIR